MFMEISNKLGPLKKKYVRTNHSKFITKELIQRISDKALMLKTKLGNLFLKPKIPESRMKHKKPERYEGV